MLHFDSPWKLHSEVESESVLGLRVQKSGGIKYVLEDNNSETGHISGHIAGDLQHWNHSFWSQALTSNIYLSFIQG